MDLLNYFFILFRDSFMKTWPDSLHLRTPLILTRWQPPSSARHWKRLTLKELGPLTELETSSSYDTDHFPSWGGFLQGVNENFTLPVLLEVLTSDRYLGIYLRHRYRRDNTGTLIRLLSLSFWIKRVWW